LTNGLFKTEASVSTATAGQAAQSIAAGYSLRLGDPRWSLEQELSELILPNPLPYQVPSLKNV